MLKDSSQVAYKTRFKELRWRKLADPRSNHEESVPQALSRKFRQEKTVQKYLSITFSTDRVPLIILSLRLISLTPCTGSSEISVSWKGWVHWLQCGKVTVSSFRHVFPEHITQISNGLLWGSLSEGKHYLIRKTSLRTIPVSLPFF